MTEITEDLNEKHLVPTSESPRHQSLDDENDFSDDEELNDEEQEIDAGELTPNDIFGLDPLDVLTLEELAEYLKVSTAAAHRVIKEQKLPGRNIGGEWRFLRDAVANWLRGQEAPVQQQQKAREEYSKPKAPAPPENEPERFTRPPQRPYQSEQSGGGEYRPRQRFPEGGQQYGNQQGTQYGNRGGQYSGGQYSGGQYSGGQYSGGQSSGGGQYGGGGGQSSGGQYGGGASGGGQYEGGSGGSYSRPPRRPFRAAEGGYSGGTGGGYSGGGTPGAQYGGGGGGGGYAGGGQRFSGGPKRKNKRQVFDNERGKRLDRRKEGDATEGAE